MDRYTYNLL